MKIENIYLAWECDKIKDLCRVLELNCTINQTKDDDDIMCYEIVIDIDEKHEKQLNTCIATMFETIEKVED